MAKIQDEKLDAIADLLGGRPEGFCADWRQAIVQAGDEEKPWREDKAAEALKAFKGDPTSGVAEFNIYHSNIETLVPALYNSAPIPDVRRRFQDEDKVAQALSQILERAISFSIDDYDFDDTMKNVVKDMTTVDRGISRIKYEPTFDKQGNVTYEEALCEIVDWSQFRRGPAKTWRKVPWIAFAHFLDRNECRKLVENKNNTLGYDGQTVSTIMTQLKFNYSPESKIGKDTGPGSEVPRFGKRELVWEIWDKDTKTIVWLSEDYGDLPLAVMNDTLGLKDFYPTPRPAMTITATDSLVPITSFEIYSDLIRQLNDLTKRITAMTKAVRVRGAYAGVLEQMKQISSASDGELIALDNAEIFATTGGGLDKAIMWWPLEQIYKALEVLVQQREVVKQTIYEVTGMADIVRGATDPNETATAQQLKEKWGSIRVQAHQKEVERYARDLFRLKAEIFCKHFNLQTLLMMTGLKFPTEGDKMRAEEAKAEGMAQLQEYQAAVQMAEQAGEQPPEPPIPEEEFKAAQEQIEEILGKPTQEEIEAMMRNERVMKYRVDVESDSTVRADLTKSQEQMKGFLDGIAAYAGAVGPIVQEGIMPGDVAVEILAAFTRHYRLGKQAEDALEKWAEDVKKQGVQGKPPDPVVTAEADLKAAQAQKTRTETEMLPRQQALEEATKRGELDVKVRQAENADKAQAATFELQKTDMAEQSKDRKAERGMRHRELNEMERNNKAQTDLARDQGAQNERMERIRLSDARSARREGYANAAQTMPTEFDPAGKQVERAPYVEPQMDELEEIMTGEERRQLDEQKALMQGIANTLQTMAEMQAQQTQALQAAIEALTQAILTPKEVVRDASGRAVSVAPQQ